MSDACGSCDGACAGADLHPYLTRELGWLWEQVARAADRRGDPDLSAGRLHVTAPADPDARAAARGLLGGRPLAPGGRRAVDLAALTAQLRQRGPHLTPGAVAAHAQQRRLAAKAAAKAAELAVEERLRARLFAGLSPSLTAVVSVENDEAGDRRDADSVWAQLRRTGWVARLRTSEDPEGTLVRVLAVVAALPEPGERMDRRQLADRVLDNPHGLDDGETVPTLVLALLDALGRIPAGLRARPAWAVAGVDYDDLTGGLLLVGLYPAGWQLPAGTVVTVPPRELARVAWPRPAGDGRVFVTENPSVLAAAAELATGDGAPRVVCTAGTPSALEVAAVAGLAETGWRVGVRADFDGKGLEHMRALLTGVPGAAPWRMGAADYQLSVLRSPNAPRIAPEVVGETSWDPELGLRMRATAIVAFEESLLPELLGDVTAGSGERGAAVSR